MTWATNELKTKNIKSILTRVDNEYLGLRYNGFSIGAFYKDIYFVFDNEKVYVTSIAIGKGNEPSPVHYLVNRASTNSIIKELNALKKPI